MAFGFGNVGDRADAALECAALHQRRRERRNPDGPAVEHKPVLHMEHRNRRDGVLARRLHLRAVFRVHPVKPAHAHHLFLRHSEQLAERGVDVDAPALGIGLVDAHAGNLGWQRLCWRLSHVAGFAGSMPKTPGRHTRQPIFPRRGSIRFVATSKRSLNNRAVVAMCKMRLRVIPMGTSSATRFASFSMPRRRTAKSSCSEFNSLRGTPNTTSTACSTSASGAATPPSMNLVSRLSDTPRRREEASAPPSLATSFTRTC